MSNISDDMYELMMYMIGYGNLKRNFVDALDSYDDELVLELAKKCDERWGLHDVVKAVEDAIEQEESA